MPEPKRRLLTPAELPALKIGFTNAHRLMIEKQERFSKLIRLGHRTVAYYEDEILAWIETQANKSPATQSHPRRRRIHARFRIARRDRRNAPAAVHSMP